MKIAMFGGSFDPIHNGHTALAQRCADRLELNRLYIVPASTPPHKSGVQTPGEHRLEMCRLALEEDSRLAVSDIELRREGKSYTFYTVCQLLETHPDAQFYLIVGADMFVTLESWHRFDELKKLVTFCTVPRDAINAEGLRQHSLWLKELGCTTIVMDAEPVDISSTMIRQRAAEGLPLEGLVPPAVEEYIYRCGLYTNRTGQV